MNFVWIDLFQAPITQKRKTAFLGRSIIWSDGVVTSEGRPIRGYGLLCSLHFITGSLSHFSFLAFAAAGLAGV